MSSEKVLIYGANWCGDCIRTRRFLREHNVPFEWIDIDRNREGELYVLAVNRGMRSVPTLVFTDGSILVEPSNFQLANKLGFSG